MTDGFSLIDAENSIQSIVRLKEDLLVGTEGNLHILEDYELKKYYIPNLEFPQNIVEMSSHHDVLAMLTQDQNLYLYRHAHQILKLVDTEVTHMALDAWDCLWYSKQDILYQYTKDFNRHVGPLLIDVEIRDGDDNSVMTYPIEFDGSDNYCEVIVDAIYPPTMNRVSVSYQTANNGPWKDNQYSKRIILRNLTTKDDTLRIKLTGLESASIISQPIPITVKSNKGWWYLPLILSGLGILILGAFWGLRKQKRDLALLEEDKDKIRTQLDLNHQKQKLGQLQMNPHFLFNSLNSINGLIAMKENKKARKYLNQFSQMMRKLLEGSLNEYLTLEEEISFLETYISLEKMIRNDIFDYEIIVNAERGIYVPAMMIQPFVENAIIHGLKHKEDHGQLTLRFEQEEKHIKVTVSDNGIGRQAAAQYRTEGHQSAAVDIITERLKMPDKWWHKGITYRDMEESGQAAGTEVTLYLPSKKINK